MEMIKSNRQSLKRLNKNLTMQAKKTVTKKKVNLPNGLLLRPISSNVVHVTDIDRNTVSDQLYDHLVSNHMTYRDMIFEDHIINIGDALEEAPQNFKKAIKALNDVASKQESDYIRFIIIQYAYWGSPRLKKC